MSIKLKNDAIQVLPKCVRVEVIDERGRSYVNWDRNNEISLSVQDNEKTLKVFVKVKEVEPIDELDKELSVLHRMFRLGASTEAIEKQQIVVDNLMDKLKQGDGNNKS